MKTEQELIKIVYEILENVGVDGTYPLSLQEKLDKEVYKIYNLSDEDVAIVEALQNEG